MRADGIGPPAGLGGQVADHAPPGRSGHARPIDAVCHHLAPVRVEIGDRAQQPRLAGARGTHYRDALAVRDLRGVGHDAGSEEVA
ncbi:MAG TPA: hypothetical protein VFZ10_08335, partial [Geminicoccaceae bacterium]